MSIFIVDSDRAGYKTGRQEHKMGQRASPVGALHFDNIELPKQALLGPLNRGFHMMMSVLDKGRVGISALAVGILQAALDASVKQAKDRKQFGQPICRFPGGAMDDRRHGQGHPRRAADDVARGLATRQGCAPPPPVRWRRLRLDAAVLHTANAVQAHGGMGYIRGMEVERLYRDAKSNT